MQKKHKFLAKLIAGLTAFSLFGFTIISVTKPEKVNAVFDECAPDTLCFFKDVADYSTNSWEANAANGIAGTEHAFRIGIWNTTSDPISNVTVQDTLPGGLTYIPGTLTVFPEGTYTDTDLFAGGINFGTFASGDSIQMSFKVEIDNVFVPGNYSYTNSASVSATGGYSSSNTATINVTVEDFPQDSGLNAYYYNNKTLFGSPTFTRVDPVVNSPQLSWSLFGGSGGGLGGDNFSVKWEGQVMSNCSGPITIKTNSDDGLRVFLNNQLIIDKWFDREQPVPLDSADVNLTAGTWNNIRIDYYQHGGGSIAQLFWNSTCQTGGADQIIPQQNLRQTYTGVINYGLTGEYFNNENLAGSAVLNRTDLGINFNFDLGSPAPGVNIDKFSIKWTGMLTTDYSDTYRFCTTSDDGTRLWIDDVNVIDQWTTHGLTEYCGNIDLTAGTHNIRMDYFDHYIDAAVELRWSSPSQTGGVNEYIPLDKLYPIGYTGSNFGLNVEFFNNTSFSGVPVLTRVEGPILFDYGTGSPHPVVNSDNFSVRWSGTLKALETGNYNFIVYSDDGVRVTIDGVVRIDHLVNQSLSRTETGPIALTAGDHSIVVEYYDSAEAAGIFFVYTTPSNGMERTVPLSVLLPN
ncbi:DUF11 domain-containing protein [Candidatus Dojkabacteria bacterium]|nr:DUF11 domain-containing protein [Candidatus Dojkabacteria bacterium]